MLGPMGSSPAVLVIDDSDLDRQEICGVLQALGYTCSSAPNGHEGLRLLREQDFDIVTCDLTMPTISGLETLRMARQLRPDLKAVVITGSDDTTAAIESLRNGAMDFLVKPVGRLAVDEMLKRLLASQTALTRAAAELLELKELVAQSDLKLAEAEQLAKDLNKQLVDVRRELQRSVIQGLDVAVNLLRRHDPELAKHCTRVSALAARYASSKGRDPESVLQIRAAALLHDVGLVGLEPELVRRVHSGRALDPQEQQRYCHYASKAEELLEGIPQLSGARELLKDLGRVQARMACGDTSRLRLDWSSSVIVASEAYDTARALVPEVAPEEGASLWVPASLRDAIDAEVAEGVSSFAQGSATEDDDMAAFLAGLRAGMTIERDIRTPRGVLVASRGLVLSEERIATIRRLIGEAR